MAHDLFDALRDCRDQMERRREKGALDEAEEWETAWFHDMRTYASYSTKKFPRGERRVIAITRYLAGAYRTVHKFHRSGGM